MSKQGSSKSSGLSTPFDVDDMEQLAAVSSDSYG